MALAMNCNEMPVQGGGEAMHVGGKQIDNAVTAVDVCSHVHVLDDHVSTSGEKPAHVVVRLYNVHAGGEYSKTDVLV